MSVRYLIGRQVHESLLNVAQGGRGKSGSSSRWNSQWSDTSSQTVQQRELHVDKKYSTRIEIHWSEALDSSSAFSLTVVGVIASTAVVAMVDRMSATERRVASWVSDTGGDEYII